MKLSFRVYGIPAPQGSKRHVGKGIMVESSAMVKPWRESVKWAAIENMRGAPTDEPVCLRLAFWLPMPARIPKRKRSSAWPYRKPDLDKLIRSTMDGITDSGVAWTDDARVCSVMAIKRYANEQEPIGALVEIHEVSD